MSSFGLGCCGLSEITSRFWRLVTGVASAVASWLLTFLSFWILIGVTTMFDWSNGTPPLVLCFVTDFTGEAQSINDRVLCLVYDGNPMFHVVSFFAVKAFGPAC